MNQRIYIDTSVIGGVFDQEFELESIALFEKVKDGTVTAIISEIVVKELQGANGKITQFFNNLPKGNIEVLPLSQEAIQLAQTYIREKVVGQTSFDDCLHIAIATLNKVDILVSWNFKHIVNIYRIRGYNAINMKLGYSVLEIRSPKEIIENE